MLNSYFRHFCLYEYSFKPKVELFLSTLPRNAGIENSQQLQEGSVQMENQSINIEEEASVAAPGTAEVTDN